MDFPKKLYARIEGGDGEDEYVVTYDDVDDLSDFDGEEVATYRLVKTENVTVTVRLE